MYCKIGKALHQYFTYHTAVKIKPLRFKSRTLLKPILLSHQAPAIDMSMMSILCSHD